MSESTLAGIQTVGDGISSELDTLKTAIVDDVKGGLDDVTKTVNEVKISVEAGTKETGGLKPFIEATVEAKVKAELVELKAFIGLNSICAQKTQVYDEKTKNCKCPTKGHFYNRQYNKCVDQVGIQNKQTWERLQRHHGKDARH